MQQSQLGSFDIQLCFIQTLPRTVFGGSFGHPDEAWANAMQFLAVCTEEKAESATTSHLVFAHGTTNSLNTLVPSLIEGPSCCESSWEVQAFVLQILSLIIIPLSPQQEEYTSAPFSGFRSIAMCMGRPWFIQSPPLPYHRAMDSSTQTVVPGVKHCSWWLLNRFTKLSTSFQQHLLGPNNTAEYHSADSQQTSQQRSLNRKGRYYF